MSPRLAPVLVSVLLLGTAPSSVGADSDSVAKGLTVGLAAAGRPEADKKRDGDRKPVEVIAFLGVAPGMTVVDLIAAGGYYTEVLSAAVGSEGRVYAQNNAYVLKMRDGANDKAMTRRLEGERLPNVVRLDREVRELGLAPGSVDLAFTALNFHDIYNGRGREAAADFLGTVYRILEPGGVLGLIDHAGNPGRDNEKLHRIEEGKVREAAQAAGFEVEASSDVLRHLDDDRSSNVFAPGLRGKTDRFVLRLRKPRS